MKFRKKAVVVEAVQLRWDTWTEMCEHADVGKFEDGKPEGCYIDAEWRRTEDTNGRIGLRIPFFGDAHLSAHREGLLAVQDDWIVRDADGLSVYKPDVFVTMFESIEVKPFTTSNVLLKYDAILQFWLANTMDIGVTRLTGTRVVWMIRMHPKSGEELHAELKRIHGQHEEAEYELKFYDAHHKARRGTGRITMPSTLDSVSEAAVSVRKLTDAELLRALQNVGCDLACDACAEVFFTRSKTHEHTCPKGR